MIYLIGGAPKTGKTSLAKLLSRECQIPWISADTLQNIVRVHTDESLHENKFPSSFQKGKDNDEKYTNYSIEAMVEAYKKQSEASYEAIEMFVLSEITDGNDFSVEGYQVTPKLAQQLIQKFGADKIKALFFSKTDNTSLVENFEQSQTPNDWILERTTDKTVTFPKIANMIVTYSQWFQSEAKKYGLELINADRDFDITMKEAVEFFDLNEKKTSKSYFSLPYELENIEVKDDTSIRYPKSLVKKFIEQYTKPADIVFDPFAGFGTTLKGAQELGRVGIGIEYEKIRCDFISKTLKAPSRVIHGSALEIEKLDLPKVDFCITSPPYMRSFDDENPFSNYHEKGRYEDYLKDIADIYRQIKGLMKPNAKVVIEVSNTFGEDHPMTPLAWDIARVVSAFLFFERELIFLHESGSEDSEAQHSYCLLFENR